MDVVEVAIFGASADCATWKNPHGAPQENNKVDIEPLGKVQAITDCAGGSSYSAP